FHTLQNEWKACNERMERLRASVTNGWAQHKVMRTLRNLWTRLEAARQRRDELAALLGSLKYQLIHTDWRSLRDDGLEQFLAQVFHLLGYHARITKKPDQGVDLVVTGNGLKLAVQAKGYHNSVGNDAVQEVVAGMPMYQCTSCVVITNSRFTRPAQQLAHINRCRLIDGAGIPDLIEGRIS